MPTADGLWGFMRAGAGRAGKIPALIFLAAAFFVFGSVSGAQAVANMEIGGGSSFEVLEGSSFSMGCGNFTVLDGGKAYIGDSGSGTGILNQVLNLWVKSGGALSMMNGLIEFSGTWTVEAPGGFDAGSQGGTVAVVDECSSDPAVVNGDNTFCSFVLVSSSGKQINFEAGTTQTVACHFEATGVPDNLERLLSTSPGQAAYICLLPDATQFADYLYVADVQVPSGGSCQTIEPGDNSEDGGNTNGWGFPRDLPVPTLNEVGFSVMALLMLLLGWVALKRKLPVA